MTRTAVALLAVVALSGCAAPGGQVDYSVKGVRTDVRLGSRATPRTAPLRHHATDTPGFPAPTLVPPPPPVDHVVPSGTPSPTPTPNVACRKATPLDFPKQEAAQSVTALPAAGLYAFRESGTTSTAGKATPVAPHAFRRVAATPSDPGAVPTPDGTRRYDYDVTEALPGGGSYRTYYEVVTGSALGANDGIYLYETEYVPQPGATPQVFTPVPAVRLVALPMDGDLTSQGWHSVGTDAVSGVTMTVDGTVAGRERVDACGTVIDTFRVDLTGNVIGADKNETFTIVDHVATQLGGLFVASKVDMTGTDAKQAVAQHVTSVISSDVPVAP